MISAYSNKNVAAIIDLYDARSKAKIRGVLSGSQGKEFLEYVSQAVNANLKILGGFEYQDGFMAYTKDDINGLHENFMVKENNKYKLASLDDKLPTGWNIALFLKFDPKPVIPLKNIQLPDSLQIDDSVNIKVSLPEAHRWVAVYADTVGEPIRLIVQDNGADDHDPMDKQISFYLEARRFIGPGTYTFYISSFNYPVQRVSKNFFLPEAKHLIRIY